MVESILVKSDATLFKRMKLLWICINLSMELVIQAHKRYKFIK
jgi:hypothetical protein